MHLCIPKSLIMKKCELFCNGWICYEWKQQSDMPQFISMQKIGAVDVTAPIFYRLVYIFS